MVSPEKMRHARPYVIVGAFTIAAFITPPDVISQTLLAVPMWLMYEAGLWFGTRIVLKRDAKKAAEENPPPVDPSPTSTTTVVATTATTAVGAASAVQAMNLLPDLPGSAVYEYVGESSIPTTVPEEPKDSIIHNDLETDDDFERAFADMDNQRAQLNSLAEITKSNIEEDQAVNEETSEDSSIIRPA
jgi:sec-independent protein translocase protein TatC